MTYDVARPPFARVSSLSLTSGKGAPRAVDLADTTRCYKVVTTYYVASLLGSVSAFTNGALSVDAKENDCATKVADLSTHIVHAAGAGAPELKQWQAVTSYFSGLPDSDGDGVPNVPAAYRTPQARVVTDASRSRVVAGRVAGTRR